MKSLTDKLNDVVEIFDNGNLYAVHLREILRAVGPLVECLQKFKTKTNDSEMLHLANTTLATLETKLDEIMKEK